jgi:ubiquinone/menaquinone biosynthesis C-methylase UbiE
VGEKKANECNCSIDKCDILDFMAKHVGVKVLHPGGLKASDELARICNIDKDSNVVDIACGKGTSSYYFAKEYGCTVTGIDIDECLLKAAEALTGKRSVGNRLSFKQGNAENLPFEDNIFDIAIFQAAFVLMKDNQKVLDEAARVIKQGGRIGILELTWLMKPTEEALAEASSDVCAYCIPKAKTSEEWEKLIVDSGLKVSYSKVYKMNDSGVGSESFSTLVNVMWKMITNGKIRDRISKVNKYFNKYSEYLGYGIYIGEKHHKS